MLNNYVGVFNERESKSIFVYVGNKRYFPSLGSCELFQRIDLRGMNLKELYDDAMKENVLFGSLVCHPNCIIPPKKWEAINMGTSVHSIEEVIKSAKKYFAKNYSLSYNDCNLNSDYLLHHLEQSATYYARYYTYHEAYFLR